MFKQVETWKQEEIEHTMAYIERIKNQIAEWKNKCGYNEMVTMVDYQKIGRIYKELTRRTEADRLKEVTKMVDSHYEKLQGKVEKYIGQIKEIQQTGENGYDYRFIGENGGIEIQVIKAGGWNIQIEHTRWIIKK